MRRSLIAIACLLWLFAGCGSQTPDSMTAAIYDASTIELDPV